MNLTTNRPTVKNKTETPQGLISHTPDPHQHSADWCHVHYGRWTEQDTGNYGNTCTCSNILLATDFDQSEASKVIT
jgi:hypothetical protein